MRDKLGWVAVGMMVLGSLWAIGTVGTPGPFGWQVGMLTVIAGFVLLGFL